MASNAQQVGQKHKSEEYQCRECGESKVFNPFDDKGRIQSCPACQAKHPGLIKTLKNLDFDQWTWIVVQAVITLCLIRSNGDGNGANWARAIIFNLAVAFLIYAVRRVWLEPK
jgi:hypothetical protein